MATITRRRTVSLPDDQSGDDTRDDNLPALNDDLPEQTDVDRVGAMLQLAGGVGRASVKIYKIENGKSIFCDSYSPSEFEDGDFKMIRDAFGAGSYKIMLYGLHAQTGTFGLLGRTELTLAENRSSQRAGMAAPQNDQMMQILATIADGQRAMLQAIADSRPEPIDPMAQMQTMLQTMTMFKSAMGLDNQNAAPKSSISEIIDAVRELKSVASEISPGDGDGGSLTAMLPQVLELIRGATNKNTQAEPEPQRVQPVHMPMKTPVDMRFNNPVAAQPIENDLGEDMRINQILELRKHMATLVQMAEHNAPTSLGVDLVFEYLPDEFIEMLRAEHWFEGLKAFEPKVANYREWFDAVRVETLQEFDNQAAGDDAAPVPAPAPAPVVDAVPMVSSVKSGLTD